MKPATKLGVAVLLFCFFGIPMASANATGYNYREAKLQKISTAKSSDGIVLKETNAAIKPETADKQRTAEQMKKTYANEDKGFGVASGFNPKKDSSQNCAKAFNNHAAGAEKKKGGIDDKNLEALTQEYLSPSGWNPAFCDSKTTKDKEHEIKVAKLGTNNAPTEEKGGNEKTAKPT
jgi:hypothetical protein